MDDKQQTQPGKPKTTNLIFSFLLGSLIVATPSAWYLGKYSQKTKQMDWITIARICVTNSKQLEQHVKQMMNHEESRIAGLNQ